MLMHVFGVGVGMTFSGGLIDMFLFGMNHTGSACGLQQRIVHQVGLVNRAAQSTLLFTICCFPS